LRVLGEQRKSKNTYFIINSIFMGIVMIMIGIQLVRHSGLVAATKNGLVKKPDGDQKFDVPAQPCVK